jgi:thymidylate synthase (FAD)
MSVRLVSHMGDDAMVARAAWVSTDTDDREATAGAVARLIGFLLAARPVHASPFGHPHVTVLVECPIFVAREWMRHRVQTFSEVSSRYADMSGEAYLPPAEDMRKQIGKPGAYAFEPMSPEEAAEVVEIMQDAYAAAYTRYRDALSWGVAREVARNVLPLGTTTRFYATASLRNWLGFLVLRNHEAALLEIRREAQAVEAILRDLFPVTLAAWEREGRPTL